MNAFPNQPTSSVRAQQQAPKHRHCLTIAMLAAAVGFGAAMPAGANAASPQAGAPAAAPAKSARHKVIFQVSDGDPKKWNLTLNNARNVQTELGAANVAIEIVAYGPGIGMLKADSESANRVQEEALSNGVKVVACENTMTNMKLAKADMLNGIGYVRAGVVELMVRQKQGYAYIRP